MVTYTYVHCTLSCLTFGYLLARIHYVKVSLVLYLMCLAASLCILLLIGYLLTVESLATCLYLHALLLAPTWLLSYCLDCFQSANGLLVLTT